MRRLPLLAPIPVLVLAAALLGEDKRPAGKYRKPAAAGKLRDRLAEGDFAGLPGRTHVPFWRAVRAITVQVEVWHRLRYKRDDVARDVKGPPGVRPLDLLLATSSVDVR